MKNKKVIIAVFVVALLCGMVAWVFSSLDRPLVAERKMSHAMADIYMVDAMFQSRNMSPSTVRRNRRDVENAYHSILSHYGISKADYDSALVWYTVHPEKLLAVYDRVVNILSTKEGEFNIILNQRDSITKRIQEIDDSLNVSFISRKSNVHIPVTAADSVRKDFKYTFDLDSVTGGTVTMKMRYAFLRGNKAKVAPEMELVVVYNDTVSDTTSCVLNMSRVQKQVVAECNVRDTLRATKIVATFVKTSELKDVVAVVNEMSLDYLPCWNRDSLDVNAILLPPLFAY